MCHYSGGDVSRHLVIPEMELMTDQSKDTTKNQLSESMNCIETYCKSVYEGRLKG